VNNQYELYMDYAANLETRSSLSRSLFHHHRDHPVLLNNSVCLGILVRGLQSF
jgi:hypothetical protein